MRLRQAIGIDIGGTNIAVGLVDETGKVRAQQTLAMDHSVAPLVMIDRIEDLATGLMQQGTLTNVSLSGIGIGAPGPLDVHAGLITCPPNLPKWRQVPIVAEFEQRFGVPVALANDANAATLGEKWVGAAQGNNHFVCMTIGTGIGAGIFLNGVLLHGATGNAGELGHIMLNPNTERTCVCGQKGCFEWYASGTAIARRASVLLGQTLTAREVFDLYKSGQAAIVSLVEEVFHYIGAACVTLINLLDPEKIIIGGGVAEIGEPLFAVVRDYVSKYPLNPAGRQVEIAPAGLRTNAGIIGAASLILCNQQVLA